MKGLMMLFVLFSLLFIYERKAINVLMAYIGMTIAIAIIIANNELMRGIEGEYVSYILILVQVSALTILFGFIIMLYPNSNPGITNTTTPKMVRILGTQKHTILAILSIITILVLPYNLIYLLEGWNTLEVWNSGVDTYPHEVWNSGVDTDISLLRRIGEALYTHNITIMKLLIVTIILLVAIVGLFFLFPTP